MRDVYGLSPHVDLAFFLGRQVEQVCVGAHQAILNFDSDVTVTIEGHFSVCGQVEEEQLFTDPRSGASALIAFIGESVADVAGQRDGTLTLTFGDRSVLELRDSSRSYESYQINHGSEVIVV